MNKTELIAQLAKHQAHLTKRDVSLAVNCILRLLQNGLKSSNRIEIRGFGTFSLRLRPNRSRINLKTGKEIMIPAHHAFHFKPAKELRLRVNNSANMATTSKTKPPLLVMHYPVEPK